MKFYLYFLFIGSILISLSVDQQGDVAQISSNNQKYSIPSTNAKEITWSSSNEKYPLLYKWSNGKTYKCDGTPDYCKVTNVNGKTVFKYKGSWDKTKNEDDCVWDIYVSYEGKTISLNDFMTAKQKKQEENAKELEQVNEAANKLGTKNVLTEKGDQLGSVSNPQGVAGLKGEQGIPGPKGERGERGIQGKLSSLSFVYN